MTTLAPDQRVHGTNPQLLIEKILRERIYESLYWKSKCFALTAETLIDRGVELKAIGGAFSNQKPTDFICLVLKLLQLDPEKEIVKVLLDCQDFKYIRALGAFYLRLTGSSVEIYQLLEPLLQDKRKLRRRRPDGKYDLTYMDEFIDELLRSDRVCDTILPRLTKRHVLEEMGDLEPRISSLQEELDKSSESEAEDSSSSDDDENDGAHVEDGLVQKPDEDRDKKRELKVIQSSEKNKAQGALETFGKNGDSVEKVSETKPQSRLKDGELSRDKGRDRNLSRDRDRGRDTYADRRERDRNGDRDGYRERDRYREADRYRERERDQSRDRYRDRSRDHDRYRDRSRDQRRSRSRDRSPRARNEPREEEDALINDLPSVETKKKKDWSSKKVNALFKKSKTGMVVPDKTRPVTTEKGGASAESLSIEETNKMRISLGLKPLKQ